MGQREEIKSLIIKSGLTIKEVVRRRNEKYLYTSTVDNFSHKLSRGTLRLKEAEEIADIIGYRIEWVKERDVE